MKKYLVVHASAADQTVNFGTPTVYSTLEEAKRAMLAEFDKEATDYPEEIEWHAVSQDGTRASLAYVDDVYGGYGVFEIDC